MSRRILVTGGAGFIGSHLVDRLSASGADVQVLDDLSHGDATWVPATVPLHRVDVRDAPSLERLMRKFEPTLVAHLAAIHYIPEVEGAPALAHAVNVEGTGILMEALAAAPPEFVLFASTGAVYPDRRGPIAESCPPDAVDHYGRTKLDGERIVRRFAAETGARHVIARLFNVIGRRETNPHVVPELVGQLRRGSSRVHLGALDRIRDYTDVADVADALVLLLDPALHELEVVNVGSGRGTSVRDLVTTCERILGRPVEIEIDPSRQRAHDRMELVADVRALRRAVAWSPTRTLEETLTDLLRAGDGTPSLLANDR